MQEGYYINACRFFVLKHGKTRNRSSMINNKSVSVVEAPAPVQIPPPLLHDIHAAAQRLSVSVPTIRKLVRQQRLARVPNIRKLLIPDVSLQKFANSAV
jgi:hypothetical protein